MPAKPPLKPASLRPGDTVAIVAPSSNVKREALQQGYAALQRAGYRTTYLDSILDHDLYFAGSLDRRVRELEEMFERDDVRAILCARGGYGANYLLNRINIDKIKAHPKIFVGYSDITALLTYFSDAAGLVTFHGPMAAKDWVHKDGINIPSWNSSLSINAGWQMSFDTTSNVKGLVPGTAAARLYGGCLSILTASLGTPYEIHTDGTILFLEDIAAKPYQIDRMLMQLKLAGKFDSVRGIIFGEMIDCVQSPNQPYTLQDVILRIVGDLGVPVAFGLPSGHVTAGNITLPIGIQAQLIVEPNGVQLKILEGAVVSA